MASSVNYGSRSGTIIQWGSKTLQACLISSLCQSGPSTMWKLGCLGSICTVFITPSRSIYNTGHSVIVRHSLVRQHISFELLPFRLLIPIKHEIVVCLRDLCFDYASPLICVGTSQSDEERFNN